MSSKHLHPMLRAKRYLIRLGFTDKHLYFKCDITIQDIRYDCILLNLHFIVLYSTDSDISDKISYTSIINRTCQIDFLTYIDSLLLKLRREYKIKRLINSLYV